MKCSWFCWGWRGSGCVSAAEELIDQVPVLCCGFCQACRLALVAGAVQEQLSVPSFVLCWVSSCLLVIPAPCTPVPCAPHPRELWALHMASGSQKEAQLAACLIFFW